MEEERRYTNVLLEEINAKFEAVLEIVIPLAKLPAAVRQLQSDVRDIKSDLKNTNLVVKNHNKTLQGHEYRVTRLESA